MSDFIHVNGASPVKEYDPGDAYVQFVAEPGRDSVTVSFGAEDGAVIKVGGEEKNAPFTVGLKKDGFGYTEVPVEICRKKGEPARFFLEILRPAPDPRTLYSAGNRPRFHYTPPYGYMNDPNGLTYCPATGEYHIFYQSFPYSASGGKKHWGHAVSRDLASYRELPTALYPDSDGYAMWSGTGFIDRGNDAGLYGAETPPGSRIVLVYYMYGDDGVKAGLSHTPDGGKTWVKAKRTLRFVGAYPGHIDPKILRVEKIGKWVMVCATGELFTSTDLWEWTFNGSDTPGECPDLFEIGVEGSREKKYVRTYGGSFYRVGDLCEDGDGRVAFVPETGDLTLNGGCLNRDRDGEILGRFGWFSGKTGSFYASQHFSDAPDGRIVSVSWLIEKGLDATGTWAGALTAPTEHKLLKKDGRYCLLSYPVEELSALRGGVLFACDGKTVLPDGGGILDCVPASVADIEGTFAPDGGVEEFGFRLAAGEDGGYIAVRYRPREGTLTADLSQSRDGKYKESFSMKGEFPESGEVSLRVLLDSFILECFANGGASSVSAVFSRPADCRGIAFYTVGGSVRIGRLRIYGMRSAFCADQDKIT